MLLAAESSLNDRYQTTVPKIVRRALGLGKHDKLQYSIHPNGEVLLARAGGTDLPDPVLEAFLAFLARDAAHHPESLRAIDAHFANRLDDLVKGIDLEMDKALSNEDE